MKPPTKADIRRELEAQIEAFLRHGGEVQQVARGVSGRYDGSGPLQMGHGGDDQPRSERTYVPEVVAAIEERRQQLSKGSRRGEPGSRRKPRKKIIYDDFGEPLRWQWEE